MVISPAFRLYTRSNTKQPQFINDYDVTKLQNSNYDGAKKTVFVCHGYVEIRPKWMEHIKDGLLRNVDCNVILVDWYRGSFFPYIQAAGNTRLVGAMIAELIKFLIFQTQSSVDLFHIVGFSLGAHVAGYAGSRLKLNGLTLARITGLDPAGPGFSAEDPALRLDPSDARFVDVIHTDANWLGLFQPSGHIDFYPNGGLDQAGCSRLTAVPFYTVVTFKTTSSWLVGLLRAHIVVRLFGSAGETRFAELKSRGLKRGSDETFLMSGSRNVGSLQKIQVQQKAFPWLLKWKVSKVLVKPGWSGTQADRSNNQPV
ncbi:hypothetical protein OS493_028460 [Desmophyllum pertusum]|uniref:PLAT domain-containing protein n=1 Tax=Desmophyllum pertusum TaxID=174260 RepID=A0A9W9ZNV1_9CNID|nr:hypothetical protein OS493_028460 [Desmophyllum pertusum]